METIIEKSCCINCGDWLKGRSDKKFCCSRCKNNYSNFLRRQENIVYKDLDRQMHKNHKVLKKHFEMKEGEKCLDQKPLILDGFNSRFFTGILYSEISGEKIFTVYNYGFSVNTDKKIKIFHLDG